MNKRSEVLTKLLPLYFSGISVPIDISETEYYHNEGHRLRSVCLEGFRRRPEEIMVLFLQTNVITQNNGVLVLEIEVCKPILRKLKTITDDELNEFWLNKMKFNSGSSWSERSKRLEYLNSYFSSNNLEAFDFSESKMIVKWFRENNFDMDNLIDDGFATDSTKWVYNIPHKKLNYYF